jgi:hypothetical protein
LGKFSKSLAKIALSLAIRLLFRRLMKMNSNRRKAINKSALSIATTVIVRFWAPVGLAAGAAALGVAEGIIEKVRALAAGAVAVAGNFGTKSALNLE